MGGDLVIAIVFAPIIARTVRAAVLGGGAASHYVEAARLRGERAHYVMFSEALPNVMPPILVEATIRLGYAIFAVASLTFIGFGLEPPSVDLAVQIADNDNFMAEQWCTVLFPVLQSPRSSSRRNSFRQHRSRCSSGERRRPDWACARGS